MSQGLSIINTSNAKQDLAELVLCSRVAPVGNSSAAFLTCLPFAWVEFTNSGGGGLPK